MRKELLAKRRKLAQEIEELNKIRNEKDTNELINEKKAKYNFINNLLKTIGGK